MDPDLGFRLLGPLEVLAGGEHLHVGGARQRIVLSMLLLEPGRVVPVDRLIEAVWDDEPPATARSQIQIAISELRRRLGGAGGADLIATHPAGYLLRAPDDAIDVARFQRFVAIGRRAVRDQDLVRGTASLRAALACWRGAAAGGVDSRLGVEPGPYLREAHTAILNGQSPPGQWRAVAQERLASARRF